MDGELIYEIGDNKLVYTDGDYDYPEITKVVEVDSDNSYYVDYAKEAIINGEKQGNQIKDIIETYSYVLGEENIRTEIKRPVEADKRFDRSKLNDRGNRSESSGADSDSRKDVRFSIDG